MAFQIKDFTSIAASMVNWMRTVTTRITDFNIGSVARTLVEAAAAEIDELYQQMFIGLREAIPVSVYNSFNFQALDALSASGLVTVNIAAQASDVLIVAGTQFKVEGKSAPYTSTADVTIVAGHTFGNVPVSCDVPGVAGNVVAGTAFVPNPKPDGFVGASNQAGLVSGRDAETDEERKIRFAAFIASLNRGTLVAIDYGLKTTTIKDSVGNEVERVVYTQLVEPYLTDATKPIAWVQCYVHNGTGGTSDALVAQGSAVLHGYYDAAGNAVPGWKAAGVKVDVIKAAEQRVTVAGAITPAPGFAHDALATTAAAAVSDYLAGLNIGVPAIRSEIIALVMGIPGVYNFAPLLPAGDVTPAIGTKLMPGTVGFNTLVLTPPAAAVTLGGNLATRTP
jgi:uncharacterized phage protein gp47/JayE